MPSVIGTDDQTPRKGFGVKGTSDVGDGVIAIGKQVGVNAQSATGEAAVLGNAGSGYGVEGLSATGTGVVGSGPTGVTGAGTNVGVFGDGKNGVHGHSASPTDSGVWGENTGAGYGVSGSTNSGAAAGVWGNNSGTGPGVRGTSAGGDAVIGVSSSNAHAGVSAVNDSGGFGIWARGTPAGHFEGDVEVNGSLKAVNAVVGESQSRNFDEGGIVGRNTFLGNGVVGISRMPGGGGGTGVLGDADNAVVGVSDLEGVSGVGVSGFGGMGVVGKARGLFQFEIGIYGKVDVERQAGGKGWSGYFEDAVHVGGMLEKAGGGFRIDHPSDPANKYLNHSFVESAEMKNIYDGTVILNERGEATVTMPSWFESLNRSFHYQLTSIGSPAPDLHIGSEIENGKFRIAGGRSGSKISWQVTGTRKDPWANAHKVPVEEDKTDKERGFYLHPKLFGQPEEKNIRTVHQPRLFEKINAGSRRLK